MSEIKRDRWGRPLIIPPNGGKPVPYMRATTLAGVLDDTWGLSKYLQRQVAVGLTKRDDLLLSVAAHSGDKNKLDDLCEQAAEAAGGSAKATIGTALHTFTERMDRGEPLGSLLSEIPAAYADDLTAYGRATQETLTPLHIEQMVVIDELQVAGTPDRIGLFKRQSIPKIIDLKTGGITYAMGKIAIQLALYAHGALYDPVTGERTELVVDREQAIVIHLPAGQGECTLHWVDIAAGWEAASLAGQVRKYRSRKDLSERIAT